MSLRIVGCPQGLRLATAVGALALALSLMFVHTMEGSDSKPTSLPALIVIKANNQIAEALVFSKDHIKAEAIYFKSPTGVKILVKHSGDHVVGHTYEFTHVESQAVLKVLVSPLFYERGLPCPSVYYVNGVRIAGIVRPDDGGSSERSLLIPVRKEFARLPTEFQQGLSDFSLFCTNATHALQLPAVMLNTIFDGRAELTPYVVSQAIDDIPGDVEAFQSDWSH